MNDVSTTLRRRVFRFQCRGICQGQAGRRFGACLARLRKQRSGRDEGTGTRAEHAFEEGAALERCGK